MLRWIYIGIAFATLMALSFTDNLLPTNLLLVLPDSVLYFVNYLKIPTGLNLLVSAYIMRFVIRRLHLIS